MSKSPYFDSRIAAGQEIANRLIDLRYEDTVVLAVSEGSVVVAAQIAAKLHSLITLLMVKGIKLPDGRTTIGMVNDQGKFTFNEAITIGQLEELMTEYQGTVEEAKISALREIHATLGSSKLSSKQYFRGRKVIVVSDGVKHGNLFASAAKYLHDVSIDELILTTPVCSVEAVDKLHYLADRIEILRVVPMYFGTEHYYEDNELPKHDVMMDYLDNIVNHWHDYDKK